VKEFETIFHGLDVISNDDDAELAMMASFCYYDLQDYNRSSKYARMLMKHLEKEELLLEASELYSALGERLIGAFYYRNQKFRAYALARKLNLKLSGGDQVIAELYQKLKLDINNKVVGFLDYALPTLSFTLITINLILIIYSPLYYTVLLVLLVLLILNNYKKTLLKRMIDFFL
jgi:hypothetical protein